jgi:hypothetical protein
MEEVYRLLAHELIHVIGVETRTAMNEDLLRSKLPFEYEGREIRIQEAFVDFTAIIMNILLFTVINNLYWKKVLVSVGWWIIDRGNFLLSKYPKWRESTNALSYYAIKSLLFRDIDYLGKVVLETMLGKSKIRLSDNREFMEKLLKDISEMRPGLYRKNYSLKMINI